MNVEEVRTYCLTLPGVTENIWPGLGGFRIEGKISRHDIHKFCAGIQGDESQMENLYRLTFSDNTRIAFNALWIFTHFDTANIKWLCHKKDELISRVLSEKDIAKRRLMLTLLSRMSFEKENLRSDFIDFCITKITACSQPYGVRALCIKLAWKQMKFYPELVAELKLTLDMLERETLSPGLASARRQILKKMK